MTAAEEWRPVVGHEGAYEVSSLGRVRSLDRTIVTSAGVVKQMRGRVLRPGPRPSGHLTVVICGRSEHVHLLVLYAFVGPRPSQDHEGRHRDSNPTHNALSNLVWSTRARNTEDRKWIRGRGRKLTCAQMVLLKKAIFGYDAPPQRTIAAQFGVAKSLVGAIAAGRLYRDI